ncbi:MAG: epimerase [Polaromonas sp.]
MKPTVLILGARGRFGMAAARAFAAGGWRVLAQCRPGGVVQNLPGIEWVHVPLENHPALLRAAQMASVVVHAINVTYTEWATELLPALEHSIALAAELKALLMLPGNVYNFGEAMPTLLTEDTPQLAHTRKGSIRIQMEQRLRSASKSGLIRSVVIRAGDFFGSGKGSWFDLALAKNIAKGKLTYPGRWDVPTAWAYLPDLGTAFERVATRSLAAQTGLAAFEVYHFKGYSLTGNDWANVLQPLAQQQKWLPSGTLLKKGAVPWGLFKAMRWAVPVFFELAEMHYLWQRPHALTNDKLVALIGSEPHTELPQAAKAALTRMGVIS